MQPAPPVPESASWVSGYHPPAGFYDEFLDPFGTPRPAWTEIDRGLRELDPARMARRQEALARLVRDNGVTYNIYGDPAGPARPWSMDLLPLLLPASEWQWLESALRQRVHLFNLLLQDSYGPQHLLQQGVLPPALLLANPEFLRPLAGTLPPRGRFIHLYAADLARSPDGRWWVLKDRLEAPSGLGYAMENRLLSHRLMGDLLRRHPVRGLDPFLQRLAESYAAMAPRHKDNPRVVFLTPGPANETYFEQSYLARNLGFTLAEGEDLTVRDNQVFLKTVGGIHPVDVIIRRVDSAYCDPLELRSDSLLGVPGLVHAVRARQVVVLNALGAGILETPALAAFLPALSRHLLGEDLQIPSVATWWCGQPRERALVLDRLPELVVKPTFRGSSQAAIHGPTLSRARLGELRRAISADPAAYCAQEMVAQATAPVFAEGALQPRHFLLRVFLFPHRGRYHLLPASLTRTSPAPQALSVSMQSGGTSKDTWFLSAPDEAPDDPDPPAAGPLRLRRDLPDLPSRVADNLFWLGRYVERAESQARLLRVCGETLEEAGLEDHEAVLTGLFHTLFDEASARALAARGARGDPRPAQELELRLRDPRRAESVAHSLGQALRSATSVKERLSLDTWQVLAGLEILLARLGAPGPLDRAEALLAILERLQSFSGLSMENMTRGLGWRFLDLGRRIERGLQLCNLLHSVFCGSFAPVEVLLLRLLMVTESLITYRRRYLNNLQAMALVDLLALDESNPRSLAFQCATLADHLHHLPDPSPHYPESPAERLGLSLYSAGRLLRLEECLSGTPGQGQPALARFLDHQAALLADLSETLTRLYFSHTSSRLAPALPER